MRTEGTGVNGFKTLRFNLLLPLFCALLALALLFAVSLLPQSALEDKVADSARQLASKSAYVFDNERIAYVMDYNTDALIVMESYTLDGRDPASVLTNPMLWLGEGRQVEALGALCAGEAPNVNYVRYWMGFRLLIRPLLLLFSYDSINWLLSLLFFSLFVLMLAGTGSSLGFRPAACFGLGLILVNPAVAAHSPQYVSCFVLAFAAMLFLLRGKRRLPLSSVFVAVGVLTQFFDFYTVPVLTLGLPLLLCLEAGLPEGGKTRGVLRLSGAWLYGYGSMWLLKLLLTTLVTRENGFANGFGSLLGRLARASGDGTPYRVLDALRAVWGTVFPGMMLPLSLGLFLVLLAAALLGMRRKTQRDTICAELLTAALPLVWFSLAVQPTIIHAWFQYRGIAVTFCGLLLSAPRALGRPEQKA